MRRTKLPKRFIKQLIRVPESGAGYHVVDIKMKTGEVLKDVTVENCSFIKEREIMGWTTDNIRTIITKE